MTLYEIRRFYRSINKPYVVIVQGLTLKEARLHCRDPQRSNIEEGWFDGFTKQFTDIDK